MPKQKSVKVAKRFRKTLLKKETKSEQEFEQRLKEHEIEYKKQHIIFVSWWRFFIADFYLPKQHLLIEVNGGFHYTKKQRARDKWRRELLKNAGYKIVEIKNENVDKFNIQCLIN